MIASDGSSYLVGCMGTTLVDFICKKRGSYSKLGGNVVDGRSPEGLVPILQVAVEFINEGQVDSWKALEGLGIYLKDSEWDVTYGIIGTRM